MKEISDKRLPFRGVALALIVLGAGIFAFGLVAWKLSMFWHVASISAPFEKAMGGAIIMALGYIVLELELIRDK